MLRKRGRCQQASAFRGEVGLEPTDSGELLLSYHLASSKWLGALAPNHASYLFFLSVLPVLSFPWLRSSSRFFTSVTSVLSPLGADIGPGTFITSSTRRRCQGPLVNLIAVPFYLDLPEGLRSSG